jgi:hypothetical protein
MDGADSFHFFLRMHLDQVCQTTGKGWIMNLDIDLDWSLVDDDNDNDGLQCLN